MSIRRRTQKFVKGGAECKIPSTAREILKKMVFSSLKKSNCEVSFKKWWVFGDVVIKFHINATKLSIFPTLKGEL